MNKCLLINMFRSIRRSFSRFLAILIIVATGFASFAGIKAAGPDMLKTAEKYFIDNNLMDLRIQSDLGLTAQDAQEISGVAGVDYVMPQKFVDALVSVDGKVESDMDGSQISARAYGINLDMLREYASGIKNPAFINRPDLLEGRYPTAENECLVDASALSTPESFQLGSVISLSGDGESLDLSLSQTEFTIVGIIRSPMYLSFERGNTLIGSGKLGCFIYIPDTAILSDYYSEIYVTVQNADSLDPYSDDYLAYVKKTADAIAAIAPGRLSVRAADLNATLPSQITQAQTQLNALVSQADAQFSEAEAKVSYLESLAANGDAILAQAQAEYNAQYSEQSTFLADNQNEYTSQVNLYNQLQSYVASAQTEWNANYSAYQAALAEFNEKQGELQTAKTEFNNAQNSIANIRSMINTTRSVFDSLSSIQGTALNQEDIQNIVGVLEAINPELYNAVSSLTAQGMADDAMALITPQLEEYEKQLSAAEDEMNRQQQVITESETALQSAQTELQAKKAQLDSAKTLLDQYTVQLNEAKEQLDAAGVQLQNGNYTLSLKQLQAQQQLAQLEAQVETADEDLQAAQKELEDARADVNEKIEYAQTIITNGQETLSNIATAKWSVYDRTDTPGYSSFGDAAANVNTLANIFPVFFILVAALVSLTTMTRMVEDERLQLGTLKALGYTDGQIMSKYILYALFASILGSILGVAVGLYAFPYAINAAYGIMFAMPPLVIGIPYLTIVFGFVVFCVMAVLVSYAACRRDLMVVPAVLMRPKAPKNGKRVLLEKWTWLWNRLSFTSKVTVRNTFRTPKRFILTIVGIAGCTALLFAGMGMYHSVGAIMTNQYGENGISQYDMQIVFDDPQPNAQSSVMSSLARDNRLGSIMLTSMTSVTGYSENSDHTLEVYVLTPQDPSLLPGMIRFVNAIGNDPVTLSDNGAVITKKFADTARVAPGDSVQVQLADGGVYTIPVSAVVENYTFDYVYLTPALYQAVFGTAPSYHYAMATLSDAVAQADAQADGAMSAKAQLAADLMDKVGITAVAYTSDTIETFNEVVKAMTIVVSLLIVAAAVLEMVVLYNLANVNIQERLREIATLKVVGFYDKEVSSYIYRENIILTVLGAVVGLGLGVLLHRLMLHFIVIDTVTYGESAGIVSFLVALVATLLFSMIVNLLLHRKLKKVSMVESFKSME